MLRMKILALAVLVLVLAPGYAQPCPISNFRGSVFSARIVAALDGGVIPLGDDQDTQCYNYSLPYAFNGPPDVAVAVHDFEAEASNNLYFFIKPIRSDSQSFLPFVVRTQWPYTQWNQITFSFLAGDRGDLELGYYQVDSGPLAGCENGKSIDVLLPFRSNFAAGVEIKHNLFLHGFEIATIRTEGRSRSPFQIQIVQSATNVSGIALQLSVTTITQVNSVYISYIAYQRSQLELQAGSFVYDITATPGQSLFYAPDNNIPRNYARIFGLTGFVLNFQGSKIGLQTSWDGFSFRFNFGSRRELLKYFSFSFIFFTGSECQGCPGYEIYYNNACVNFCPAGTSRTPDNTCITCGTGREWNGSACVTSCPRGQYLSPVSGLCECPPTLNWNGQSCIPCLSGRTWNASSRSCQCQRPLIWNGYSCAKIDTCTAGRVWDVYTYSCQCPDLTYWNGVECKTLPQCRGGQVINSNYQCSCPNGFVWSQDTCIFSPCIGGQVWTGSQCVCPAGLNFNGSLCLECINGQKWNSANRTCSCESGYKWNGGFCEISFNCSNGRVWNPSFQQCICPTGFYWSGFTCLAISQCTGGQYFDSTISKCVCQAGFQWDGRVCVQCNNGRIWNVTSLTCTCPVGTLANRNGCSLIQQCSGGKEWNQNSWTCECPDQTVWNGAFCIANACSNGRRWNDKERACQCLDNKVWINDSCVPPIIACTNGRVWNQFIYACECPASTFNNGTGCVPVPVCTNGRVYNPLNNQCQCPFGLVERGATCAPSNCPVGQFFNGIECQVINCPPPSYFQDNRCVVGNQNSNCQFGFHWNGNQCVFNPIVCPNGTVWNSNLCVCQASGQCSNGFYLESGRCIPLPQLCIPPTQWDGKRCTINSGCPNGTYSQGTSCLPFQTCRNGFVWDSNLVRCVCPVGTINAGSRCVDCSGEQKWNYGTGCDCPDGSFDTGASCQSTNATKCRLIANAIWNDNRCLCRPGFTKVGLQCVCYGTQTGDLCDRCSYKPNSNYIERRNTCECRQGFTEIRGICVKNGQQVGNDDPNRCSVGTYFDATQRMCLACPDGCLSCDNCYQCRICRPEFIYDPNTEKCVEICGDGRRFNLECDDGNNQDGDGCSRDCKTEKGFTCSGGSLDSPDNCYFYRPDSVKIETMGQIRRSSSVVINVRLNFLPAALLQSTECANKCSQILAVNITSGDRSSISINSEYLVGTNYIFAITVEFGRPYIGRFTLNVNISSALSRFFGGMTIQPLDLTVEPSFLAAVQDKGDSLQ